MLKSTEISFSLFNKCYIYINIYIYLHIYPEIFPGCYFQINIIFQALFSITATQVTEKSKGSYLLKLLKTVIDIIFIFLQLI